MNAHNVAETLSNAKPVRPSFQQWFANGYRDLIPVVPPNAAVSPTSHVAKGKGKSPGVRYANGLWAGLPGWNTIQATIDDLVRWEDMEASVGLRTGEAFLLDIDAYDEATADKIEQQAIVLLGPAPMRVGQWPKRALLYRSDGSIKPQRLQFAGTRGEVNLIEIPPQAVIQGTHARTGKPYEWRRKPKPFDQITVVSGEKLRAFLETMRKELPSASLSGTGGDDAIEQGLLRGHKEVVAEILSRLPNTREMRWDFMVKLGYAVRAALPDDPDLAFELWDGWCSRWEDEGYDPDAQQMRWSSFKGPYRIGADWLYRIGDEHIGAGEHFAARARLWDGTPLSGQDDGLAADDVAAALLPAATELEPTPFSVRPASLIPQRQWLYGRFRARGYVTVTVAPGGLGKSSMMIVEALAMASGKPLLGIAPPQPLNVWLYNLEDPFDELERRIAAAMQYYQLTAHDIEGRLYVDSGRDREMVIARQARNGAQLDSSAVAGLENALRSRSIDVLSVDPFVSAHRVRESDNGDMDLVVKAFSRLADACNISVDLTHHSRKSNGQEPSVDDARGASALVGAARSVRVLARMEKKEAVRFGVDDRYRHYFRVCDGKNNLAPPPASLQTEWLELHSVSLANGKGNDIDAIMSGDSVGVVRRWTPVGTDAELGGDAARTAYELIRDGSWRRDIRAGADWVGNPIAQAFGLDAENPTDRQVINQWLTDEIRAKRLRPASRKDEKTRKRKTYVELAGQNVENDLFS